MTKTALKAAAAVSLLLAASCVHSRAHMEWWCSERGMRATASIQDAAERKAARDELQAECLAANGYGEGRPALERY